VLSIEYSQHGLPGIADEVLAKYRNILDWQARLSFHLDLPLGTPTGHLNRHSTSSEFEMASMPSVEFDGQNDSNQSVPIRVAHPIQRDYCGRVASDFCCNRVGYS
jgi:hypothetical protein